MKTHSLLAKLGSVPHPREGFPLSATASAVARGLLTPRPSTAVLREFGEALPLAHRRLAWLAVSRSSALPFLNTISFFNSCVSLDTGCLAILCI
jgi:hypothetical protein